MSALACVSAAADCWRSAAARLRASSIRAGSKPAAGGYAREARNGVALGIRFRIPVVREHRRDVDGFAQHNEGVQRGALRQRWQQAAPTWRARRQLVLRVSGPCWFSFVVAVCGCWWGWNFVGSWLRRVSGSAGPCPDRADPCPDRLVPCPDRLHSCPDRSNPCPDRSNQCPDRPNPCPDRRCLSGTGFRPFAALVPL